MTPSTIELTPTVEDRRIARQAAAAIVLTVAEAVDPVRSLEGLMDRLTDEMGVPDLILGCDCILRRLEIEQRQLKKQVSDLLARNNVVGFCAYGEQHNAMHVNQTFTGVAIGCR